MRFKIVLTATIFFIIWIIYSKIINPESTIATFGRQRNSMTQNETKKSNINLKDLRRNLSLPLRGEQLKASRNALGEFTENVLTQSLRSKKEFEDIAYITFEDKFKEFEFSYLGEIDDNMVMLAGLDSEHDTRLKLAAAPINPSIDQVLEYIKENQKNMFQDLSIDGLENLKPYKTIDNFNNFRSVEILSGIDQNNNIIILGLAKRKDGKGSYLATLTGPKDYIWSNEGKFEQLFSTFTAKDFNPGISTSPKIK